MVVFSFLYCLQCECIFSRSPNYTSHEVLKSRSNYYLQIFKNSCLITATIVLMGLGSSTSAGLYYQQAVDRSLTAEMLRPCGSVSVEFFIKTVPDLASIEKHFYDADALTNERKKSQRYTCRCEGAAGCCRLIAPITCETMCSRGLCL